MSHSDRSDSDHYLPTAALQRLKHRSELLEEIRRFFRDRDYWEVETPILSHDIVVDAYLEPFATQWQPAGNFDPDNPSSETLFLQTSPEFGMKRLLAAGAEAIFQITRAFRNGEVGRYHNPEFTMLEWYRTGNTHHEQMQLTEELTKAVFAKSREIHPDGKHSVPDLSRPFVKMTYDQAFERFAGTKVLHLSLRELAILAKKKNIAPPPGLEDDDRDGWLNLLLAELVEPHLGQNVPLFLYDYPASQSALAKVREDDPPVSERFELYIQGIELCNGYHELTDADELRKRMQGQAAIRKHEGRQSLPNENRLLDAMEAGLPDCAGVALGVDRLLMLALGAESIAEVTAFPFDRA